MISDSSQFGRGQPAITYGLRGICYFELTLTGPRQDLHSGVFGGAVRNPAITLCQMLSTLIDSQGRIQVPGFYDGLDELSDDERQQFAVLSFDEAKFMDQLGVTALAGEAGYSTLERRWADLPSTSTDLPAAIKARVPRRFYRLVLRRSSASASCLIKIHSGLRPVFVSIWSRSAHRALLIHGHASRRVLSYR